MSCVFFHTIFLILFHRAAAVSAAAAQALCIFIMRVGWMNVPQPYRNSQNQKLTVIAIAYSRQYSHACSMTRRFRFNLLTSNYGFRVCLVFSWMLCKCGFRFFSAILHGFV